MGRKAIISNDFKEAIATADQFGKVYKNISKQFEVYHPTVRNRKTFKKVAGHPKRDNPADSLHDQRSLAILHSHTFGKKAKTAYQHKHHILAIMHGDTEVKI